MTRKNIVKCLLQLRANGVLGAALVELALVMTFFATMVLSLMFYYNTFREREDARQRKIATDLAIKQLSEAFVMDAISSPSPVSSIQLIDAVVQTAIAGVMISGASTAEAWDFMVARIKTCSTSAATFEIEGVAAVRRPSWVTNKSSVVTLDPTSIVDAALTNCIRETKGIVESTEMGPHCESFAAAYFPTGHPELCEARSIGRGIIVRSALRADVSVTPTDVSSTTTVTSSTTTTTDPCAVKYYELINCTVVDRATHSASSEYCCYDFTSRVIATGATSTGWTCTVGADCAILTPVGASCRDYFLSNNGCSYLP